MKALFLLPLKDDSIRIRRPLQLNLAASRADEGPQDGEAGR